MFKGNALIITLTTVGMAVIIRHALFKVHKQGRTCKNHQDGGCIE